ncbi:MAG: RluA family pseudouridine synthase [Treponema sp.]|nr:RluA family pseudouridine synthase [Treponema sp.]
MTQVPVLYENEEIYIINKPSGVAVQGGSGISHPLDEEFAKQVGQKVHLVHRLDKDTAGLMIVAKTPQAASKWTKLISSKQVQKTYTAYCFGSLSKKKGVINDTVIQHGENKVAVTNYQVLEEFDVSVVTQSEEGEKSQNIKVSKISLELQTGRMHQIRIHLSKNNCPIIGDDTHGNFKLNKLFKKVYKIKNLQLYSTRLAVPIDGKNKVFEIEDDFKI